MLLKLDGVCVNALSTSRSQTRKSCPGSACYMAQQWQAPGPNHWQHVRLPPRRVCRFLGWHVLKLEFWHFARPKLNLSFLSHPYLRSFLAKTATTGGLHCPKLCSAVRFASFFSVFSCVCRISHRFLQCFCHLSTFCTCQLRLAFVFELCAGVWGRGDGGGVMTSMRLRLVFSFSFGDLLLLGCFPVCVAFRIGFCSVSAISRLSAHASFDLHLSLNSVQGFGGGWGVGG